MSLTSAFAFLTSVVLSFVFTWTVRKYANQYGWASPPVSQRHIHVTAIPRLGGVGIFCACYLTVLIAIGFAKLSGFGANSPWFSLVRLLGPGAFIFVLGLVDDLRPLGPYQKFAGQAVAASLLWLGGLRIVHLPILFGAGELHFLISLAATIVWVLWITNAFNLIDGVDGLAAGSAIVSTLVIFIVSVFTRSYMGSFETAVLAGAILGFLRFNFNPATIFLGDCGSLFIGFMLSALALQNGEKSSTMIAVAIPIVSFGLPVLETALSVGRRFVAGRPLFSPDREHIHHKLLDLGFSQRQVVVILYGVTAFCGALSLLLLQPGARSVVTVLFVLAVGIWIGVQKLGYREWDELVRVAQRTLDQKGIIVNNLAFRRVARDLQSACDFATIERALRKTLANNDFDRCELVLTGMRFESPTHHHTSPLSSAREGVFWSWQKDNSLLKQKGGWSMNLALLNSGGVPRGTLSLQRYDVGSPLRVDVNVITNCGFHTALADALDRALNCPANAESAVSTNA
jgi:UDP-GlcNAc:undecaprenyl-phosphate/decaprenyl-phosphate GlcNAc-1-phosphate transferase